MAAVWPTFFSHGVEGVSGISARMQVSAQLTHASVVFCLDWEPLLASSGEAALTGSFFGIVAGLSFVGVLGVVCGADGLVSV